MITNYLKIAFRNLLKNPTYSFINIFGLSVGISCCILIMLWVNDEASYDRFLPKVERLYQVNLNMKYETRTDTWFSLPLALDDALKNADAAIANSAVASWRTQRLLAVDDKHINKSGYAVSDKFLEMFEFKLLSGSPEQALDDPKNILITTSTAKALFGDTNPLGKIVRVDDKHDLHVSGVLADHPTNSSFRFDYLVPFAFLENTQPWVKDTRSRWDNYNFLMFAELKSSDDKEAVEASIKDLVSKNWKSDGIGRELFLHNMTRWRLHDAFKNGVEDADGGMIQYVKFFSFIAVFILVIACINFMNLATARSEKRAREVGIRKSIGSNRKELIFQFLGESVMIALTSFLFALLLTEFALPFYNEVVTKQLAIDYTSGMFWGFAAAIVLITGIFAGSYPAFYLSSFKPAQVLKGLVRSGIGTIRSRQVLVASQFGFAVLLIAGTIIVARQIAFIKSRDLGYQQENLITIATNEGIRKNINPIKNELLQSGVAESVTTSNGAITEVTSSNVAGWPGKPDNFNISFATIGTHYDYAKTMGISILEGRDFQIESPADSNAVIVNKAALDLMELKDPIGQEMIIWGSKRPIIGVFNNTVMESPFEPSRPAYYILSPRWASDVTIRLSATDDLPAAMAKLESIFKKYTPNYPFEYKFVDDEFNNKFWEINLISRLVTVFSALALIITGLGLFGLAAFTAEQRTKEIGIRKILGASVRSIIALISKDFTILVIAGFTVAGPIAWYLVKTMFLEKYTFRIDISWWIIPTAGAGALLFALIIVSTQAFKAARSNPVDSLRSE